VCVFGSRKKNQAVSYGGAMARLDGALHSRSFGFSQKIIEAVLAAKYLSLRFEIFLFRRNRSPSKKTLNSDN